MQLKLFVHQKDLFVRYEKHFQGEIAIRSRDIKINKKVPLECSDNRATHQNTHNFDWTHPSCVYTLKILPFANISNLESNIGSISSNDDDLCTDYPSACHKSVLLDFDKIAYEHIRNCKTAHINVNALLVSSF